MRCPAKGCGFEGSAEEVADHVYDAHLYPAPKRRKKEVREEMEYDPRKIREAAENILGPKRGPKKRKNPDPKAEPRENTGKKEIKSVADLAEIEEKVKQSEKTKEKPAEKQERPKAEKKAESKPERKELDPLRKITISRATMQITIPAPVRDKALEACGETVKSIKLSGKRTLTEWDPEKKAMVTRIVEG